MNRIKNTIGYADFSCNPYPGCWGPGGTRERPKWCSYCYARRIAERFRGTKAWPNGFDPTPRFDRLEELGHLRRPYKIFMGDAGDLFGDWVSSSDLHYILRITQIFQRHTYLFLTKNPARLREFNPWPPNVWVGVTATDYRMLLCALNGLSFVEAKVRFLSLEPLLDGEGMASALEPFPPSVQGFTPNWVILGGLTGPRDRKSYPKPEWVEEIKTAAHKAGIPIWEKENLTARRPLRQEYPK